MNWILEHIQLIAVVAGAIAVWLNQRRREKSGEPADYDEDGVPDNPVPPRRDEVRQLTPVSRDGSDPEQAERVRRIQEEIRRKIAERRGQAAPPAMPAPTLEPFNPLRPVFREQPAPPLPRTSPPVLPVEREVAAYDDSAALERQRRMAEQLAELDVRRRESRRTAQALAETGAGPVAEAFGTRAASASTTVAGAPRTLAADLRDPKALRRAMVLREVLDVPVAFR